MTKYLIMKKNKEMTKKESSMEEEMKKPQTKIRENMKKKIKEVITQITTRNCVFSGIQKTSLNGKNTSLKVLVTKSHSFLGLPLDKSCFEAKHQPLMNMHRHSTRNSKPTKTNKKFIKIQWQTFIFCYTNCKYFLVCSIYLN